MFKFSIYGEIIRFATAAQNNLDFSEKQFRSITEIKIANRKMVEIIKDARELNKNVTIALNSDNKNLKKQYDGFRKKVAKVLRVIYLFRKSDEPNQYEFLLSELKKEAKDNVRLSNKSIDKLIRKNLITAEMASSLFNDYTNVNDMIKKLIEVAELLYSRKDSLLEDNNKK